MTHFITAYERDNVKTKKLRQQDGGMEHENKVLFKKLQGNNGGNHAYKLLLPYLFFLEKTFVLWQAHWK